MIGHTVLMELRTGWKSVLMVCVLAMLVAGGMTFFYPTFRDSFSENLEGVENVVLVLPEADGEASLSWTHREDAMGYVVFEDESAMISNSSILYYGTNNYTTFHFNTSYTRYFTVMAYYGDSLFDGNVVLVGMATNSPRPSNPFAEMLENNAYSAFTGGRDDLDMMETRGFLSVELFSWWWILAGLFMAYYSVSVITGDFEGKRMDLLFSTPLSRDRYIVEKYLFLVLMSLLMVFTGGLALVGSLGSLGLLEDLPANIAFLSMLSSLPLLMLIAAIGVLLGIVTRSTKAGMGANFAIVFGSFILYTISALTSSVNSLKYASMMYYWDYNSMLLDEVMPFGRLLVLLAASMASIVVAICLFKKMDIPA